MTGGRICASFFLSDSIFGSFKPNNLGPLFLSPLRLPSVYIHAHAQLSDLDRDTNKYKRTIQIRCGKKSRKKRSGPIVCVWVNASVMRRTTRDMRETERERERVCVLPSSKVGHLDGRVF